ncbi:MAG: invasion-associated locus B family protein [Candidatus Tokpelaia sp.]|nr:MAG: invasion-associated locus B family protein [Candidatus Tokpelaia sp.]
MGGVIFCRPAADLLCGAVLLVVFVRFFLMAVLGAVLLSPPARGQNGGGTAPYSLRPPPLSVPAGEPGAVRRSIMQFYQWTLICDTVFADKTQVCNVSQAVWDAGNMVIFSWSLAASDKGDPFLLLRTLPDTDTKSPVRIALKGTNQAVNVAFVGCNAALCLAQTPVGPFLTQAIRKQSNITVSYRSAGRGVLSFDTSFLGLKEAVAAAK